MKNRLRFLTLAAGVLLWGVAATEAKAGTVAVNEDGGIYNFSMTSKPLGGGMQTVSMTFSGVFLSEINDNALAPPDYIASALSKLTISSTSLGGGTFDPFSATGTKTFGGTVSITYMVQSATTSDGFLNMTAVIPKQAISPSSLTVGSTTYDFSPFKNGGDMILSPQKVGVDIGAFIQNGFYTDSFGHKQTTLTGTGGFTEIAANAVPEPASLALLGIGMTGFLAFRRFFKKTSVA